MTELRTVIKYKVYCEGGHGYVDTDYKDTVPTVCPLDSLHAITTSLTMIVDEITDTVQAIKDDESGVGGYWKAQGTDFDITSGVGVVTQSDFSFPYPVRAYSITICTAVTNIGDYITMCTAPDTDLGAFYPGMNVITADVSTAATNVYLPASMLAQLKLGFAVKIKEGVTENDLGECINIDLINNKITVTIATTQSFTSAGGAKILFSVTRFKNIRIVDAGTITLGTAKIGGSLGSANLVSRFHYTNTDGVAGKNIAFIAEVQY